VCIYKTVSNNKNKLKNELIRFELATLCSKTTSYPLTIRYMCNIVHVKVAKSDTFYIKCINFNTNLLFWTF
jgi:hypothetical protein